MKMAIWFRIDDEKLKIIKINRFIDNQFYF